MKNDVRKLAFVIMAALVALCIYLAFIPILIQHAARSGYAVADPRITARENLIKRGSIFDRNGVELARSVPAANGGFNREYPLGRYAAHIIGYHSGQYGTAGLERTMAPLLMGQESGSRLANLRHQLLGQREVGGDITLTINADLQRYAVDLLNGQRGAVVALNPVTGEVLALVSYPDFDPAKVADYVEQSGSPLLNRAVQGAYPPGSVFKIVTAAGVLAKSPHLTAETINCTGSLEVEGFVLRDNAVHGNVDFEEAFAKSCNVAFGQYGLTLQAEQFVDQARAFGVGKDFEFPLPVYRGNINPPEAMNGPRLASSAIGQGEILISPLQVALLASAVANDGVIMKPYLVASSTDAGGFQKNTRPVELFRPMDYTVAQIIKQEMIVTVERGTGRAAAVPGVSVAGKTGSAENPQGKSHAWFVGFAPADEPQVVVAVILENKGAGGTWAAPVARDVMRRALQQ